MELFYCPFIVLFQNKCLKLKNSQGRECNQNSIIFAVQSVEEYVEFKKIMYGML